MEPHSVRPHRATLHHSATVDCPPHFRFTGGPPQRTRPPLRKSIRIDQSVYPTERQSSEEGPGRLTTPESGCERKDSLWESSSSNAEPCCRSSFESQCEHECEPPRANIRCKSDKSCLSATNDTNSVITVEPRPADGADRQTYDKHNSFRSTRMRGTSSDRIIAKKRHDQKSVSSLGESGGAISSGLFEKHLGKFYKLGKLEKQKRSSANALYDRSPTEAFYNKTGSARLSSQELFEKFCSEDFVSLYGHENDNGNYPCCEIDSYGYSKSLESSQLAMQVNSMIIHDERCSPGRRSASCVQREMSLSHASLGAIRKTNLSGINKMDGIHACKQFDYSTEICLRSPSNRFLIEKHYRTHFSFDVPFSLPPNITDIIDYEIDDSVESLNAKDHSQSAPLLSPDREGTQFVFEVPDISKNEQLSNPEDSPSDATETRNLTLYEEPHSDRTSLSDTYEPCFSTGIRSKRSSIKRDLVYRNRPVFDLTNLDFRPIDDESPNTSKFVSVSSPDYTIPTNFDSKSYYSDSVFVSPERNSSREESTKREDASSVDKSHPEETVYYSERSDSTTLEEDPGSMMDKIPEIFVEKFDQLSMEYINTECRFDYMERALSPLIEQALEAKSDSVNLSDSPSIKNLSLNVPDQSAVITSRPSMHKLEPFYPRKLSGNSDTSIHKVENTTLDNDKFEKVTEPYDKVVDLPGLAGKRDKSMFFKIKKVRDSSTVAVHRRTRCFPL